MNLVPYIKAGYPILWIQTSEESRAEATIHRVAEEMGRKLRIWSFTQGFFSLDPKNRDHEDITDPTEALGRIQDDKITGTIFVFRDLHPFLAKGRNPKPTRAVRDITTLFKQRQNTLIILTPSGDIPPDLDRDVTMLEFGLPTKEEIRQTFNTLHRRNREDIGDLSEDEIDKIVESAMGLTVQEAETAFAKALVEWVPAKKAGTECAPLYHLVLSEKASAVRKSGLLEYYETTETEGDVGGLDALKEWMRIRSNAFSRKAREFGLPMPRGIMLVGLPGCGKSLSAKAMSTVLGVPLLRLDVGRVFGGLVGESESNLRRIFSTCEAIGPSVLWIDELDKAFAGMTSSFTGDSGVSKRVFGNFITWMQEKTSPVFIVATVNRIEGLPPELLRKGRFDELFYVGLPSETEREQIFRIHVKKYNRDPDAVFEGSTLTDCISQSDHFSGAEIAETVVTAMYRAFYEDRDIAGADILTAVNATNPLFHSKAADLAAMVQWAEKNAVNASVPDDDPGVEEDKPDGRKLALGG